MSNHKNLDKSLEVICPWCNKNSTISQWDDLAFSKCLNRQMRRDFKHLDDPKTWTESADAFFICPKCEQWSRSTKLKIANPTNSEEGRLGGEPLFSVIKE